MVQFSGHWSRVNSNFYSCCYTETVVKRFYQVKFTIAVILMEMVRQLRSGSFSGPCVLMLRIAKFDLISVTFGRVSSVSVSNRS